MLKAIRRTLASRHNVRAHFWQSLANYTQAGGGMLLGIILARLLEPAVFGEFVFITASLAFLMIPASFSTAQLLITDAGRTPDLFNRVLGVATVVAIIKALILISFASISVWQGDLLRATVAMIVGLPLVFADVLLSLRYDLEGQGIFKQNFYLQAADLTVHGSVAVALILKGYGIYGLAGGGLAGFLTQAFCYSRLCRSRLASFTLDWKTVFNQFRTGFWLWLGSVSSSWYSRVDKILLGHFGTTVELGYYNRAMNYGPISHVLLNSMMTNPTIRALSVAHESEVKRRLFLKTMAILIVAACVNGVFWHLFAEPIVPLVFGKQWQPAAESFAILGWLGIPYCLLFGSAAMLYSAGRYVTIALIYTLAFLLLVSLLSLRGLVSVLTSVDTSVIYCVSMMFGGILMLIVALLSLNHTSCVEEHLKHRLKPEDAQS